MTLSIPPKSDAWHSAYLTCNTRDVGLLAEDTPWGEDLLDREERGEERGRGGEGGEEKRGGERRGEERRREERRGEERRGEERRGEERRGEVIRSALASQ
jgi:hypothetical protein